jgi:predicted Holliday junction resolvase-like endonuclease
MPIEWLFILVLLVSVLLLVVYIAYMRGTIETRARDLSSGWRSREEEETRQWKDKELARVSQERARVLFDDWKSSEEAQIRSDAVKRSHAVTRGKITEHLIPYFPDFPYNPKDARFLGSPVDLIVFDGLSEEKIGKIVFIEIKTSANPALNKREREVRTCVQEKRVDYLLLKPDPGTQGEDEPGGPG